MARSRFACLALVFGAASATVLSQTAAETVLIDFTSPVCPPCREMEPLLRQLAGEGYSIRRVDVTRDPELARRFSIAVTPTFVVLVDGQEWARLPSKTDRATLVEMIRKATALAEADRQRAADGGVANVDFGRSSPTGPATAAVTPPGPREGLVVPIQNPFARRTPSRVAAAPPSAATTQQPAAVASGADHLVAATVRLSIADPDGRSTGTGVVVDARNGMALVLTCGHLFRASHGEGAIEISRFAGGSHGAEPSGTVPGELLDFDLDRDLALVRFRVDGPVNVAPVAPVGTQLAPGASATSVGCDHGDPPTPWATQITAVNRYQGHPNVEAARAPVEGRSGGGLFNAQGQLIGVCFAADPQGDEGLYASLTSIHDKLNELNLAMVYQTPAGAGVVQSGPDAAALAVAATPSVPVAPPESANPFAAAPSESFAVRGQNPSDGSAALPAAWPGASTPTVSAPTPAPVATPTAMTPDEQAALAELARRGVGAEVICIIRPQAADGRSEVIKISGASPAFVEALTSAAEATATGPVAAKPPANSAAPAGYLR